MIGYALPASLYLQRDILQRNISVYVTLRDDLGHASHIAQPLTMTPIDPVTAPASATFTLTPEEAQRLMDHLWDLGIRPSEGTGSAGALAATERHLHDLQALIFDHLIFDRVPLSQTGNTNPLTNRRE